MRPPRGKTKLLISIAILCLLLAAGIGKLLFGSIGDCRTNADCPAGRVCMEITSPRSWRPWWARFHLYRTCEIPCQHQDDCPQGYSCVMTDDGPGPGWHCYRSSDAK